MSDKRTLPPPALSAQLARAFSAGSTKQAFRLRGEGPSGLVDVVLDRRLIIGSSASVDIVLHEPTVSRIHAEIVPDETGVVVRDLGSRNGVFVDRVQVQAARLNAGHALRIGGVTLRIDAELTATVDEAELWPTSHFGPLVGQSPIMRELFATLAQVSQSSAPVFVRGETGTGKELVARAIHGASPRASGPYVVVDCAALPENLLEAELFGHARGAFTGANVAREGAIESANGGTVFLDEIGELPLSVQPKLLRVLEQRVVRRLGENDYRPVDVRFIAATHRDLLQFVARGEFREDLYFRLAVLPVSVPALRDHREDLELLVCHLLGPEAHSIVTPSLIYALSARPWRGNVRELRNVLDRAKAFGVDSVMRALRDDAEPPSEPFGPERSTMRVLVSPMFDKDSERALERSAMPLSPELLALRHADFRERWGELGERAYLEAKLRSNGGNVSKLSREIELARTYTHKLIKKHGL